ncbi:pyruvate dehydrogenase complex dihydrolipoamide acetyltransferase [soil metagenome]
MPVEVILPRVDMDMTTGTISKWHVKDGDTVRKGAPLFEIETNKAAMEVESPADGVVGSISAVVGTTVPVASIVAYLYGPGEARVAPALVDSPADAPAKIPSPENLPAAAATEVAPHAEESTSDFRATPLARRLAREAGNKLTGRTGSGPRGRIVAADIAQFEVPKAEAAPARKAAAEENVSANYEPRSFTIKPLEGMRRTIAQRLTQSKQTVPHFYLSMTCDLETLIAVRGRLNERAAKTPGTAKLSLNDFFIKALALALQRVPAANVTWSDDGILQHRASDVGVAVAVEDGLFTPVIRSAETKPLGAISREMKDLAEQARARKLLPADYRGGTTAISNLGMYGVDEFAAIINPPQATILAVGAGVERPASVNRVLTVRTQMTATLSCDHRAVDGAVGAQLLAAFRDLVEDPALMLV